MQHVQDVAAGNLGMSEYPGAKHNPAIIEMFEKAGHSWVQDDETPWCAAFANSVLADCGIEGTGKLNARSFETWGERVPHFDQAQKGDVCVFWRKKPNGPYGHVAFFDHYDEDTNRVHVLGGNQGNAVSVAGYPYNRLISLRRAAPQATSAPPKPKPMSKSSTIKATTVAGAVSAGTGVMATLSDMDPNVQMIIAGGAVVTVLACIWIFRERIKKLARGI